MKSKRVIYYDSLQDDFFDDGKVHKLKDDYKWVKNDLFSRVLSALIYAIALVFSNIYCRIFLRVRIVGAEKLRKEKNGFFVYSNHTQPIGDVFNPALVCFPKRIYTVVSPANLDIAVIGKILPYLGALPIPTTLGGMKEFQKAIKYRIDQKHPVIIYPEAHVWEYYTGIRPFASTSFKYPVNFNSSVFCTTVTYQKTRFRKRPKITIFADGPFYAVGDTAKQKAESLQKSVYDCMCMRSKESNCEYIEYIQKV